MAIIQWLEREQIAWFPIKLCLDAGKKIPQPINLEAYNFKTPTFNDFQSLSEKDLLARKQCYYEKPSAWEHIAISTNKVYQIDIDTADVLDGVKNMLNGMPHFKSTTKSYGAHIFVQSTDGWVADKARICPYIQEGVELLAKGMWSYAPATAVVHNPNENYKMAELQKMRKDKQPESSPKSDYEPSGETLLEKIVDLIDLQYCKDFDSWSRLVCAMKNSGLSKDFVEKWSMQAPNFSQGGFDNWWYRDYSSITEGTIRHYAQLSNRDAYFRLMADNYTDTDYSDMALAVLFRNLDAENSITVRDITYRYEGDLWAVDHKMSKTKIAIAETFRKYHDTRAMVTAAKFDKMSDSEVKGEQNYQREFFKKTTSAKGLRDITTLLQPMLCRDDIEFDTDPKHDNHLNFRDGVFDLKSNTLRPRCREDYFTECLPWNCLYGSWCGDIDKAMCMLQHIQPDYKQHKLQMTWLKSCLYAKNNGFFKINLGKTARNGKTTEMGIFKDCFPMYSSELPNSFFEKNNAKRHKFIHNFLTKPIRFAFIEEMKVKTQDSDEVKRFVDGGEIVNEQMYGTTLTGRLQAKLTVSSNNDASMDVDNGIIRRGVRQEYTSRFIDYKDEVDYAQHIYLAEDVRKQFENDEYKRAFFHYLIQFDASELPELIKEGQKEFAEMIQGTDPIHQIIEEKIDVTKNHGDYITRKELGELGEDKWMQIKSALERKGCKWNKNIRNGVGEKKGRLTGCKLLDEEEEEYC